MVFLVAALCCLLWGSAYPAIKNGYALFDIAADDIPSKLVFAGYRFILAGLGVLAIAALGKKTLRLDRRTLGQVSLLGLTGYPLAAGGLALLLIGFGTGGTLTGFTVKSTALMAYLVVLSSAAFSLWTLLLKYNRVSMVTVFNFMIPVFGTLLSALFLGERFRELKNGFALALVCFGIWRVTLEEKPAASPPISR